MGQRYRWMEGHKPGPVWVAHNQISLKERPSTNSYEVFPKCRHWETWWARGGVEDTWLEAKDTKKSEAKAKDSLSEDRHSRGQAQECLRPKPLTMDTSGSALQKKKVFTKIFQATSKKKKKGLHKNFSGNLHKKTFSKNCFKRSKNSAVLEPRTGQFSRTWGLEAKAKDFKMCPRGLHLCGELTSVNEMCRRQEFGVRIPSRWRLWGSWGEATSCWAIFCDASEKITILILMPFGSHFARF